MFDFEKFPVYQLAEETYEIVHNKIFKQRGVPIRLKDQLERACSSIVLNIAEGAGKYSSNDKKNYYLTARSSNQECAAALRLLKIREKVDEETYQELYNNFENIGRMLSGLIKAMLQKVQQKNLRKF